MKLGIRLNAVFNEIDKCKVVADIGTDHGLIACECLRCLKCERVIATDISESSLNKAKKKAALLNLKNIEFRLGDGLQVLNKNVSNVVIAGMGGLEIIRILSYENISKFNNSNLILSPMQHAMELRKWLIENNFKILNELIVKEKDKFYFIFKVNLQLTKHKKEIKNIYDADIEIARNQNDEISLEYLEKQIEKIDNILNCLNNDCVEKTKELIRRKNKIIKLLQKCN